MFVSRLFFVSTVLEVLVVTALKFLIKFFLYRFQLVTLTVTYIKCSLFHDPPWVKILFTLNVHYVVDVYLNVS